MLMQKIYINLYIIFYIIHKKFFFYFIVKIGENFIMNFKYSKYFRVIFLFFQIISSNLILVNKNNKKIQKNFF